LTSATIFFGTETEAVVNTILPLAKSQLLEYNGMALQFSADSLNVQQKPVMSHGVWVFAFTALQSAAIKELDLSSCGLDDSGLDVLLGVLLKRQIVVSLNVSDNSLDKVGVQQLASFLRQDKKLQVLQARKIGRFQLSDMREFSKAIENNSTLATLDIRQNFLHPEIVNSLKRTMEEKRNTVPMPLDAKITFLLCNQSLRYCLPEVTQMTYASRLYLVHSCSPLFLIFQYCGQARKLLVDSPEIVRSEPREPHFHNWGWPGHRIPSGDDEDSESSSENGSDSDGGSGMS